MNRQETVVLRLADCPDMERMVGSPAERLAAVWPLTCDAWTMTGAFDAQSRPRRDVVRLRKKDALDAEWLERH